MDFDAKAIREAQFREKMRGYNPDDVDAFLEQVAAGAESREKEIRDLTSKLLRSEQEVERLKVRLAQAEATQGGGSFQVEPIPAQVPPASSIPAGDRILSIFLHAEQSADEIIEKAKFTAEDTLFRARQESDMMRTKVAQEVAEMRDAELTRLEMDVSDHKRRRDELKSDIKRLGAVASEARSTVRLALHSALDAVENSFADLYSEEGENPQLPESTESPSEFNG
ncbi:DivIVA domain-containing protein [Acidithrix ferrooxidans]|uniref:Cell wall synthesis protein Wag31 n=1 Tax=Acidithrix ferrooxidans TaxID=1280514 RepID=A0A0D8HPK9_9ACTN|nr:DivIVA domain-containing protein [Acidithrix ferrooxidans]KJF19061.1 cell cycle protein GpsB [Acidithrix ferrooxidans]